MQVFSTQKKIGWIKPVYNRYYEIYNAYFGACVSEASSSTELEEAAERARIGGKEYLALALLEAAGYKRMEEIVANSSSSTELEEAAESARLGGKEYLYIALLEAAGYKREEEEAEGREGVDAQIAKAEQFMEQERGG